MRICKTCRQQVVTSDSNTSNLFYHLKTWRDIKLAISWYKMLSILHSTTPSWNYRGYRTVTSGATTQRRLWRTIQMFLTWHQHCCFFWLISWYSFSLSCFSRLSTPESPHVSFTSRHTGALLRLCATDVTQHHLTLITKSLCDLINERPNEWMNSVQSVTAD